MSFVNKSILKGVNNQSLSFFTTTIPFTTSQLRIDTLTQYQAYIKKFRIVNKDTVAQATYRQGSMSEPLKPVPLSSEVSSEGWESFLEINPNAVSGDGFLEMDLINKRDAEIVPP